MAKGNRKLINEYMGLVKANVKKYALIQQRSNKLISEGVDISTQGNGGNTLLHLAVSLENEKLLTLFLKLGVKVNLANDIWDAPIHKAVSKGNLKLVKLLLDYGADINCPREQEQTPLHLAVICGNIKMVKFLVEAGADLELLDEIDNLPIDYAIDEQDEEVIRYFLSKQKVDEKRLEKISTIMDCEEYKWTL